MYLSIAHPRYVEAHQKKVTCLNVHITHVSHEHECAHYPYVCLVYISHNVRADFGVFQHSSLF